MKWAIAAALPASYYVCRYKLATTKNQARALSHYKSLSRGIASSAALAATTASQRPLSHK